MTKSFETLKQSAPEGREVQAKPTLSAVLNFLPDAEAAALRKELETSAKDPKRAEELAAAHPVFASLLVLHGTKLMDTLRTEKKTKALFFTSRPKLEEAATITRGVVAIRQALETMRKPERGVAGEVLPGAKTNADLFETITNGQPTSPSSGILSILPKDSLLSLRYTALAFTDTPEFRMREFLDKTVLPIPPVKGNTYENYAPNDPALIRSADVHNLLAGMQKNLSAAERDAEFMRLVGKDKIMPGQSVWTATQTIRDRDKPHTPVGKHFDRTLIPEFD